MSVKKINEQRILEIALILICVALCCLLYRVGPYRMVVLNLFYLPVVLAAFFLGRYLAGILALLCVVCAAIVTALDLATLATYTSPLAVGLALTIWAAVMGINAILVGTLSDERMAKIEELHDAYLGVVEVLVQYLNSADPRRCDRARRIAEISQRVAARMRFSDREIDDIRVAALLQDMDHIEVTARVIRKAVGDVAQAQRGKHLEHTFHGSDLVQALGSVLTGALPLLEGRDDSLNLERDNAQSAAPANLVQGTQVIRTVRSYLNLLGQDSTVGDARDAIDALKDGADGDHSAAVVQALEQVVLQSADAPRELETCAV
jgi:hypothetical protein